MITYIESRVIQPGQLTELRGDLYMAIKLLPHTRCSSQCRVYDATKERCNGMCYRWANFEDIVFVPVYTIPVGDYEVVETPFAANARRIAEQAKEGML